MSWFARRRALKKIERVERIEYAPGDTLMIHLRDKFTLPRQAQTVREQVERLFPDAKVLITIGDIGLTHVRQQEDDSAA